MGLRPEAVLERAQTTFDIAQEHAVGTFFEPQLRAVGLSVDQIQRQTLDELHQSLERVNDAIKNPDSFGVVGIKMSAEAGAIISANPDNANIRVGALPLLLQRKRLIVERIADLSGS